MQFLAKITLFLDCDKINVCFEIPKFKFWIRIRVGTSIISEFHANMPPTQFVLKFAYASNRCSCSYSTLVPTQAPSKLTKRRCRCVRSFQTVRPNGPSSEFDTPWLGHHSSPSPSHRPVSTLVMSLSDTLPDYWISRILNPPTQKNKIPSSDR